MEFPKYMSLYKQAMDWMIVIYTDNIELHAVIYCYH